MMPTNEERREVAARMRSYMPYASQKDDASEDSIVNGNVMFRNIAQAVGGGCANLTDTYEETLIKLADLIEPEPELTCRMKKKGQEYIFSGWWECDECGVVYPPCNEEIARWALQYCPHCGAKVVE